MVNLCGGQASNEGVRERMATTNSSSINANWGGEKTKREERREYEKVREDKDRDAPHWAQGEEEKGKREVNQRVEYDKISRPLLTCALFSKIVFFILVL